MKAHHSLRKIRLIAGRAAPLAFLTLFSSFVTTPRLGAAPTPSVVVWDTGQRLADAGDVENRMDWKVVPTDPFAVEADPAKASSDPGYYGRQYGFKGDAVIENHALALVFLRDHARVVLYSKTSRPSEPGDGAVANAGFGRKVLEFVPSHLKSIRAFIAHYEMLKNAGDEVVIRAFFTGADTTATFTVGKTEVVEVKAGDRVKSISLLGATEYGVVPGYIGDDLIFDPAEYPSTETLNLPSENLFLGLLKGESDEWVMTWPKGKQQMTLRLSGAAGEKRVIQSVDFEPDGQSFYLAALSAPGIWHREELKPTHLEKDVTSAWKPPFQAKWKTQLKEAGVRTTYAFRAAKGHVWRGVPGSYDYPVWFEGEDARYHLSKKVPPKGDSIVYFLEGQNTPVSIATPVDILKATLGRSACESILDVAGQKLRTHHRRGGDGVRRACTCGCTEAIQALFERGQEVVQKSTVKEALEDMNYFVQCHVGRIEEYQRFATETIQFLTAQSAAAPSLKDYLENLRSIAEQIPQEYTVQKENMKSPEHAAELTQRTLALTNDKNTNNLSAYMDLLKAWRAMGGAQDYVVAQCHTITRKLFQEAGYRSVDDPRAVAVAQEIRARCRQVLRNPDGYEIWANY